jgi:hypothetical protein
MGHLCSDALPFCGHSCLALAPPFGNIHSASRWIGPRIASYSASGLRLKFGLDAVLRGVIFVLLR